MQKRGSQFIKNSRIFKSVGFQARAKFQKKQNQLGNLKPERMEIFYYIQTLVQFQISNGVVFTLQKKF